MKKMMILAFTLFATVNAFAGAYDLTCTSADKSVKIEKGTLIVGDLVYSYYSEYAASKLMGLDLIDFLKEAGPKVVVSAPNADTNVAQAGVKVTSTKNFKDECGNAGTTTKYKEAIGIYKTDGEALVDVANIKCTETVIVGHCL